MTNQFVRLSVISLILGVLIGIIVVVGQKTRITGDAHFDISFNEDAERDGLAAATPLQALSLQSRHPSQIQH